MRSPACLTALLLLSAGCREAEVNEVSTALVQPSGAIPSVSWVFGCDLQPPLLVLPAGCHGTESPMEVASDPQRPTSRLFFITIPNSGGAPENSAY